MFVNQLIRDRVIITITKTSTLELMDGNAFFDGRVRSVFFSIFCWHVKWNEMEIKQKGYKDFCSFLFPLLIFWVFILSLYFLFKRFMIFIYLLKRSSQLTRTISLDIENSKLKASSKVHEVLANFQVFKKINHFVVNTQIWFLTCSDNLQNFSLCS